MRFSKEMKIFKRLARNLFLWQFCGLFLFAGFAMAGELSSLKPGIIKREALIREESIAVQIDVNNIAGVNKDMRAIINIKPEHVDQNDDIALATASIDTFPAGKGKAKLSIKGLIPAKYRLNVIVYEGKKIAFNHDEYFDISKADGAKDANVRVKAVFGSIEEAFATAQGNLVSITFEENEKIDAALEILDKKNVSFKEGYKSRQGIGITSSGEKAQLAFRIRPLSVVNGEKIDISFNYKTSNALEKKLLLMVYYYNKDNKQLRVSYIKVPQSSDWTFFSCSQDVRTGEAYMAVVFRFDGAPTTEWAVIDNITLSKVRERKRDAAAVEAFLKTADLEWLKKPVGLEALSDDTVLPPFTSVAVQGNTVEVWNRKYGFNTIGLPSEVVTANASILNGPITLSCLSNGIDLFSELQHNRKPIISKRTKGKVEFTRKANLKDIGVSFKSSIEYDGFVCYTMTIVPRKAVLIDNLRLEIPLKEEYARYLYAGGEPTIRTTDGPKILDRALMKALDGEGVLWQSPFKPWIWLGDDERGFEWFCNSEQGWYPQDYSSRQRAQQVVKKGKTVSISISLISAQKELKKPVTYTFGFIATPVRPEPKGWRAWKFKIKNYWDYVSGSEKANIFNYWPAPPWSEIIHSPEIPDKEKYRLIAEEDHRKGHTVLPYISPILFGYGIRSNKEELAHNPVYDPFSEEWALHNPNPSLLTTRRGKTDHIASFVCPVSRWADYMIWSMKKHAQCGADGISIFDGGTGPCRNTLHGCGYSDDAGEVNSTYTGLAVRNMCKRLLYMFNQERGSIKSITGLGIDHTHYGNGDVAFKGAFFDGGLKGEELNSGYYLESAEWKNKLFQDQYYYANMLPLEIFRIGWGHQWGWVPIFFPQLTKSPGIDKEWASSPEGTKDFMVLALLHDCRVLPHWCHVKTVFDVWNAEDKFGLGDDDVEFLPYWKNERYVKSSSDSVKVSLYRKKEAIMAIIGNVAKTPEEVQVKLNLAEIGAVKKSKKVFDGITDESQSFEKNTFNFKIPPRDYKIIIIQ